jgi:D-alanyl-D-alanine carboxypeptidase
MHLLDYSAEQRTRFAPGTRGEYSNSNYVLAGQVIEAVTGQPLDAVYRERIIDPLDLKTTWLPCGSNPSARRVRGYGVKASPSGLAITTV